MLNTLKINIYIISLITGTILACSSSSWFTCWLGLEINLISLIPLLITHLNPYSSETSIKYFIVQALASTIIIFSSIFLLKFSSQNSIFLFNSLIIVALSIKIGAAPFHLWLPQVIKTSKWFQTIIILTWQKIAPMVLILFSKNNFLKFIILSSCLIGALGAINQILIKKILVYSSILHSRWLLSSIICSEIIWWVYFSLYSLISIALISSISFHPLKKIKDIFSSKITPILALFIFMNFLSLAGIPPFLGFLIKIITISAIIILNFDLPTLLILILSSLVSLFYYLRLTFSSLILSTNQFKLIFWSTPKTSLNLWLISISSFSLLMFPIPFILF